MDSQVSSGMGLLASFVTSDSMGGGIVCLGFQCVSRFCDHSDYSKQCDLHFAKTKQVIHFTCVSWFCKCVLVIALFEMVRWIVESHYLTETTTGLFRCASLFV